MQISKIILSCFLLSLLIGTSPNLSVLIKAQTPATSSPTVILPTTSEDKDIETFKEKIATKVAELRQKNNKAVSGFVLDISDKAIKIKSGDLSEYTVNIDKDLTKYFQIASNQQKETKSDTVKKDTYIIVTGVIKDNTVDANAIYADERFVIGSGKIIEANKNDFNIKVVTLEKDIITLEIETFTKQRMLNIKTLEIEKIGFSKIKEGDTVHFVYKSASEPSKTNTYSAEKILLIPQEYFIK